MKYLHLTLALSACLAATTSMAQNAPLQPAWKWRDAGGQINVSDLPPPPSVQAKDILERPPTQRKVIATSPASATTAAAAVAPGLQAISTPRTDPELDARRKRALDDQALQQRQQLERDAAVRAENCSRAQSALALLNDGQRLTRTNAQGEREVIDDKARAEELERVRTIIASDCR